LRDQVLRNLFALFSAALVFWIVQIGLIYLSMQFEFGYKFPDLVDVYSVFLAGLAAGALGTVVSRNKNYQVLAGILLLIALPVTLIIILIPDGRPESAISFVLICAVAAYACVRGFQHEWRARRD